MHPEQQSFGARDEAQPSEPHRPGGNACFLKKSNGRKHIIDLNYTLGN